MKKILYMFVSMALVCHAAFCNLTDAGLAVKKVPKAAPDDPAISVDFGSAKGKINPVHGVNNSPIRYNKEIPLMSEIKFPFVRLHDTNGGKFMVDIENIFPNFDADPSDPASYDFVFTDAYLKSLALSGCKVFFRLGTTIENNSKIKAYRIYPPKDNLKWAKICEGIIRHYNEGWANGFKYGIEYWEIWNEPETPEMWQGTREQFFAMYETASKYLKNRFPNLKIGGYACWGFVAATRKNINPKRLELLRSFLVFFDEFLKMAAEKNAPLDFFSWHIYTDNVSEICACAKYARDKLDAAGFKNTEVILDEWNTYPRNKRSSVRQNNIGASYCAAAFCAMQDSAVNSAMYYDAWPSRTYCGLFTFPDMKPTKTYFAFWAFNELYKLGNCVSSKVERAKDVYTCAAVSNDGKRGLLFVSNYSFREKRLKINAKGKIKSCRIIDEELMLTELNCAIDSQGYLNLSDYSVALIEFEL